MFHEGGFASRYFLRFYSTKVHVFYTTLGHLYVWCRDVCLCVSASRYSYYMRFLHSSDWHLGRTFHGVDLTHAQTRFAEYFVDLAIDGSYDAVVISGDVYDRAVPPIDALHVFDSTIARLADAGIRVIVSSGNHDSFHRLGFSRHQLDRVGIHVRTHLEDILWPIDVGDCVVYAIPYLEPALVWRTLNVSRRHHAVIAHCVKRIRTHAHKHFPGVPIVVLAHAFVTGATPSESEREIGIGGVGNVGSDVFDGIAYAALGHLHRSQEICPGVVYSGSPIPYSFEEARTPKTVKEVQIDQKGVKYRSIELPQFVRVQSVRCSFDQAMTGDWSDKEALVELELTDSKRVPQALHKLKERIPNLVHMRWVEESVRRASSVHAPVQRMSDSDVFTGFMKFATGHDPSPQELELFHDALQGGQQ